jgi:tricorn protease
MSPTRLWLIGTILCSTLVGTIEVAAQTAVPESGAPWTVVPSLAASVAAGERLAEPLGFARDPHYHGGRIAYSFRGDLWSVAEDGSDPVQLTRGDARDTKPRFSPDGRWIAFTSNRMGNDDVWVMPAAGGEPRQLTFHTTGDDVLYWTPDSRRVLFATSRGPMMWESPLHTVSVEGDLPLPVAMGAGSNGMLSQDGRFLAFNRKRYPDPKRHYRGSSAAEVWLMDMRANTFSQLTNARLEDYKEHAHDVYPMFGGDGMVYFMSERDGIFNIWRISPDGGAAVQVTRHTRGGVRFPSISPDGRTITYSNEFDLWRLNVPDGQPQKIAIDPGWIVDGNLVEFVTATNTADRFTPSPSGDYLAIEVRGEILLVPAEEGVGEVTRISESAWRQGSALYSPDGRQLAYLSDESSDEEVWVHALATGERRKLTALPGKKQLHAWTPDGRRLFFSIENTIHAVDVAAGRTSEVVRHHAGGYSPTQVSADGNWLVMHRSDDDQNVDVVLFELATGREHNVTEHPARDQSGLLTPDGGKLIFISNRDSGTNHIFAVTLARPVEDPDDPRVRERQQREQAQQSQRGGGQRDPAAAAGEGGPGARADRAPPPFALDLDVTDIGQRAVQLTRGPDAVSNVFLSADGRTIHFLAGTGNARALWAVDLEGKERRKIVDGAFQDLAVAGDGRTVFFREDDAIQRMPLASRTKAPVRFSVSVAVDKRAEWQQMFDEFYRHWKYSYVEAENMNGHDWDAIRARYQPLVAKVADTQDFYMLAAEMLGELNSSHSGITAPSDPATPAYRTRLLGFEIEPAGDGLRVSTIYRDGPADKPWLDLTEGEYVVAINGNPVSARENYWKQLNGLLNEYVTVTVAASPDSPAAARRDLRIRSVTSHTNIKYEDWVARNREFVERESNGDVVYMHIRSMNQASLARFQQEVDQYFYKKAIIIDVRYNGGGNIDMQLMDVLLRRPYQYTWTRRGSPVWGRRPQQLIAGPQVMLTNWRSNSNAEMVPHAFHHLGLGTLVGTPTNGAVVSARQYPLLDGGSVRIPGTRVVSYDPTQPNNFGFNLENYGVPPDLWVRNTPEDDVNLYDRELKAAVDEALRLLRSGRWQYVEQNGNR